MSAAAGSAGELQGTPPLAALLIGATRAYRRWLSPALPARCRYLPTCSEYALDALQRRGALAGSALTLRRLLRCHPFHPGGYDPVPAGRGPEPLRRRNAGPSPPVQCATPHPGVIR